MIKLARFAVIIAIVLNILSGLASAQSRGNTSTTQANQCSPSGYDHPESKSRTRNNSHLFDPCSPTAHERHKGDPQDASH